MSPCWVIGLQLDAEYLCTHDTTPNTFQGSWSTTGMVIDVSRGDSTTTSLVDPSGEPGPNGYGHDAFHFANRHMFVVCTQTCIFCCYICNKADVCLLYEMLYPCSCNVVISC